MLIEINTNFLKNIGMSPMEYIFLMHLHKNEKCAWDMPYKSALSLQERGYLKIVEMDGKKTAVVRAKFADLIEGDFDKMFAELCSTYPSKVGTVHNYRALHPRDPDAQGNKISKARYKKIVDGKPQKHALIMKALDSQLKAQRSKLDFLQLLEVWINKATWDNWMDFEEEIDDTRRTTVF